MNHKTAAKTLYHYIQAQNRSPTAKRSRSSKTSALQHTSMSIGNVVENFDAQRAWMVADFGFTRLPQ